MKFAIILAVIALVSAAPEPIRNKRQYPLLSTTTTTLHANPVVPVVQPVVVREFIHESMPSTEAPVVAPIVQSTRAEEPVVQSDMLQTNDNSNSGFSSDVSSNSESHSSDSSLNSNMNTDTSSSVTPLPFVSSTTSLPSFSGNSGFNQDIIIPGMNTFSNIFTRAGAFAHELDPHLSVNGQAFPLVNGQSSSVNGGSFPSVSLPNLNAGSILPLNQGAILPLNQAGGILPLTQGILPLAQGLYSLNHNILPSVAPVAPIAYSGAQFAYSSAPVAPVAPIAYTGAFRSFPYVANPIVTESHHILPPKPAARQFPIVTTTTLAPEITQVKDAFPVKGHSTRAGVKGGDMGTRSNFPVKGQHSI